MSVQVDGVNNALKDVNGNEYMKLGATAAAVNELKVTNAATTTDPTLEATGDDANVGIKLTAKGTGKIRPNAPIVHDGAAPAFGRASVAGGDANYSLLATEYNNRHLEFTGALTAQRNRVVPLTAGAEWVVTNNTTGGFGIQIIGATGTGIVIAATKTAIVRCDGTNILRVTADV